MQTKDIIEGRFYAYSRWARGVTPDRVKVLKAKAKGTKQSGWRTVPIVGVKIEHKNGETEVVEPKTIKRLWADHLREEKAAREQRAEFEAARLAEIEQGAKVAFTLHELLKVKGVPVGAGYVYDGEIEAALTRAGFQEIEHMPGNFHSTIARLGDVVEGNVPTDMVGVLLGVIPVPTQPDMDYDMTDEEMDAEADAIEARREAATA